MNQYCRLVNALLILLMVSVPVLAQVVNPALATEIKKPVTSLLTVKEVVLHKLNTGFFIPPFKSGGDKDFGGNGPQMRITCQLLLSANKKQILAVVTMSAKETKANWTMAEGTKMIPLFTCNSGQTIQSFGSGTGYTKMDISVTDNNGHDDQFYLANGQPAVTQAQNSAWELTNAVHHSSGVELVRIVGDTNGDDAGVRTGVQLFFSALPVKLAGTAISEIQLNIVNANETCGPNTCGSSAASTVASFHGFTNSCEQMKTRLDRSPNLINVIRAVSGYNIGIDPNSMRDRLNEINSRFTLVDVQPSAALVTIISALNSRKPVIVLTGWGSKTIRNTYANSNDPVSLNPNSVLHYLVIDGINRHTNVLSVLDNGKRIYLHWDYLKQIIYWRPENAVIEASLYGNQVKPGKIIF